MSRPIWKSPTDGGKTFFQEHYQAEIAEFIRIRGVTRCPTACLVPTQGLVDAADRAALAEYALARKRPYQAQASSEAESLAKLSQPLREHWLRLDLISAE
jgi:hypothetical protein